MNYYYYYYYRYFSIVQSSNCVPKRFDTDPKKGGDVVCRHSELGQTGQ